VFAFYVPLNSTSWRNQGLVMPVFAPMPMNVALAPPMPALFQEMEQTINQRFENLTVETFTIF
jgi:hypothetical protein